MRKCSKSLASANLALFMGVALLTRGTAYGQSTTVLFETPPGYDYTQGGTVQVVDPFSDHANEDYSLDIISSVSLPAQLDQVSFYNANLEAAILDGAAMGSVHLEQANLDGAHLQNADLWFTILDDASLVGAHLEYAEIVDAHLLRAKFNNAILDNAWLNVSLLWDANLNGASLQRANLQGAHLEGASLVGADLSYSTGLDTTDGSPFYDASTVFTGTGFDPVAAGWTLIPEPVTLSLLGLGSLALVMGRRRR